MMFFFTGAHFGGIKKKRDRGKCTRIYEIPKTLLRLDSSDAEISNPSQCAWLRPREFSVSYTTSKISFNCDQMSTIPMNVLLAMLMQLQLQVLVYPVC